MRTAGSWTRLYSAHRSLAVRLPIIASSSVLQADKVRDIFKRTAANVRQERYKLAKRKAATKLLGNTVAKHRAELRLMMIMLEIRMRLRRSSLRIVGSDFCHT